MTGLSNKNLGLLIVASPDSTPYLLVPQPLIGVPMKTVLITGCSSGFGLETAKFFLDRDWDVVATMRKPQKDLLPASDRLRVSPLDVTDPASVARAVVEAGPIDVLVNN